ncbi:MAG: alpha/beta hydrolase [Gemmatimonadota bacterium]
MILEAGASSFAIDWTLVQQSIARANRVCSYDRAGHGWSDPPGPVSDVTRDLRALLTTAGEKPPYVLVGASMGGLYVRLYAAQYPNDVAGFVLVDPASEERLFTYYNGEAVTITSLTAEQYRSVIQPGTISVPRRSPQTGAPFDRLPKPLYDTRIKLDERLIASYPSTVTYETRIAAGETERARLALLRDMTMKNAQPLGNRPIVVLTRGVDAAQGVRDVHAALARLSSSSRHTVVANAGHEIHLFEPAAVIQAIADVIEAIQSNKPLPPR